MPEKLFLPFRTLFARWRAKTACIFCCLLAACLPVSTAHAAEAPPLRIAVDAPYYPFAYTDKSTGKLTGFDVDIAEALCRQTGRACEFVVLPFDEIIPSITARKVDISVAGMGKTEERQKHVIFTEKYFRSNSIFVTLADADSEEEFSLTGKTIAVQKNTIQETYLKESGVPPERIVTLISSDEVFSAVKQKKSDLALIDGVTGYYFLKTDEGSDLEITGDPIIMPHTGEACIVLHPSLTALRDAFNAAITELRKNGTYDAINRKYFTFSIY